MHSHRIIESRIRPLDISLRALLVVCVAVTAYPLLENLRQQPAATAEPLDCPMPASEGETWITRRWIQRGELKFECTHVFGFPEFGLPLARKVGIIP